MVLENSTGSQRAGTNYNQFAEFSKLNSIAYPEYTQITSPQINSPPREPEQPTDILKRSGMIGYSYKNSSTQFGKMI